MKMFLVGLALGVGIGFLLLPKSSDEHDQLIRERTRELQRSLPKTHVQCDGPCVLLSDEHMSRPPEALTIQKSGGK